MERQLALIEEPRPGVAGSTSAPVSSAGAGWRRPARRCRPPTDPVATSRAGPAPPELLLSGPARSAAGSVTAVGVLAWIIVGLVAGSLASAATGAEKQGCLYRTVVGILGGVIGGALFNAAGERGIGDFGLWSVLVAFVGACALLLLLQVTGIAGSRGGPAAAGLGADRTRPYAAAMRDVVIVEAVRTPIGRRGGGLSTMHTADLLATVQQEAVDRSGIDPAEVGQVVGGCVSQVGMQAFNIARTAWLAAGLPISTPATTVDSQCGSSQQATNLAASLVGCRRGRRRDGVRRREHEPGADGLQPRRRRRQGRAEVVLRPLRVDDAVRGRRAHRREVGHHPRGHRRVRPRVPAAGRPGVGRGPLRHPDRAASTRPTSATTASRRARRTASSATRVCARRTLEALAGSSPWLAPTASTPPGRRRRSPTAPAAVLLMTAEKAAALGLRRPGPGRRHVPGRHRPRPDADRPHRRHPPPARAHRPDDRRHRRHRDQRGVRLGRAGVGSASCSPTRRRSTPTAAPSPSAIRSVAPAPS